MGDQGGGDHEGLGHRGVLDPSASAVVPRRSRSGPVVADQRASVARGVVDEPRAACQGSARPDRARAGRSRSKLHRRHGRTACRFPPNSSLDTWRFAPCLQAGDDEGGAQHEGITRIGGGVAGDLADPAQPVPHSVGVDVEGSRAGLERTAAFDVTANVRSSSPPASSGDDESASRRCAAGSPPSARSGSRSSAATGARASDAPPGPQPGECPRALACAPLRSAARVRRRPA